MPVQVRADRRNTTELAGACAALERRLRAGEAVRADEVLSAHPLLCEDADAALEVIYTEFVAREALGQRPVPAEFYARFPQWRDGLAQLFEIHGTLGRDSTLALAGEGDTRFPGESRGRDTAGAGMAAVPRRVGNYELLGELGRGGMGVVYKARQLGLNRLVALKMILAGVDAGPHERARFRAEAESAARLAHPNIVQIYEVGEHEGRPFLSLEFVEGGSLEKLLAGGPWRAADAARLVGTLARAMQHAHEQGIVHRDLKPANVLLNAGDQESGVRSRPDNFLVPTPDPGLLIPKITDFGLARQLRLPTAGGSRVRELTATGAILGSPAYMAPEQAAGDGRQVGPAADVYALGAILYELLTGRPPFSGVSALETLEQVRTREPLPPSKLLTGLPRDIETICLKCLHKESGRRYENAAALAEDLGRFLRGEPVRARPTSAGEKAWKWAQRQPAVAGLLGALVVLSITALTSVTYLWRETAAALVVVKTKQDETVAALASKVVALAERDWLANDLDGARRHLEECPPEHRGSEWRKLHHACHACLAVFEDAETRGNIRSVAWSPDGRYVISSGFTAERAGMVWDLTTGQKHFTLKLDAEKIGRLTINPDGHLVSVSWLPAATVSSLHVQRFDVRSGKEVHGYTLGLPFAALALSADGRRMALTRSGRLTLVDIPGDPMPMAAISPTPMQIPTLSDDGRMFAWWRSRSDICVWDTTSDAMAGPEIPMPRAVEFAFSMVGQRLAITGYDRDDHSGVVSIWDYRTGKEVVTLRGFARPPSATAFSPDGRLIATGDETVIVWDIRTGKELITFRGHIAPATALAFSPTGARLASGDRNGTVRIWDVRPLADGN